MEKKRFVSSDTEVETEQHEQTGGSRPEPM